jgi:hypothetical protein
MGHPIGSLGASWLDDASGLGVLGVELGNLDTRMNSHTVIATHNEQSCITHDAHGSGGIVVALRRESAEMVSR